MHKKQRVVLRNANKDRVIPFCSLSLRMNVGKRNEIWKSV